MIVSLLIIIIIHINIISIYSLLHILSNVSRKDAKVICRGIAFFLFFFSFSLYTRVCLFVGSMSSLSPFLRGKGWIWSFFSSTITSLTYVTQYIYIMYISIMSNIYIIHIYLSPCKFTMARICSSIALIYFALFFYFSREYNKDLLIV